MTLGRAAKAKLRWIVLCRECEHQVEPDPDEIDAPANAPKPGPSAEPKPIDQSGLPRDPHTGHVVPERLPVDTFSRT
jgi:hypothetical protein